MKDLKRDDRIMSNESWELFRQVFRGSLSQDETRWIVKPWKNVQRTGGRIMVMCLEDRNVLPVA